MYFPVSFFNCYFLNRHSAACSSHVSCCRRKGNSDVRHLFQNHPLEEANFLGMRVWGVGQEREK